VIRRPTPQPAKLWDNDPRQQLRKEAGMMRRSVVSLLMAILAGSVGAQNPPSSAQEAPGTAAANPSPMDLDVVVTDKDGHPIPGLQQSDFSLFDDNHSATIQSFQAMGTAAGQNDPVQVIVAVDEVNTDFVALSTARPQLHTLLTQNGGHLPFPVTFVFLTDTGIQQVNQPTTDGIALDAAVQKQQATLRAISRSAGFYGGTDRMQISMKALFTLATSLAPLPGRKLMLWVSQGWWMFDSPNVYISEQQRKSFFGAIVDLSATLRQGRIAVYAVDPWGTQDAGQFRNFQWQEFLKPVRDSKHADPGDLALQVLATESGGLALFGSNNIAGELSRCIDDGSTWYRITFDPQHADAPHTWHSVEVKVDKPGLKIRTRNGYYAEP
jgi:VWFA-related protein